MQKDPFMILGVTDSVSRNELYDAYKTARREWEGKRFAPGEEGAYACERLDEIEQAYRDAEEILRSREVIIPEVVQPATEDEYMEIDRLVKAKEYDSAQQKLEEIKVRGARWHFLQSIVCVGTGKNYEAIEHLKIATESEPDNAVYAEAYQRMQERVGKPQTEGFYAYRENGDNGENRRSYRDDGYDNHHRGGMTPCDCCQGLICADCCCECMGGDLISCC
ncbi:MAG: hypothetical protein IJD50_06165 [Clostridia bacterium]|nr:hypothetical protein [Clostridia bacterium]